MSRLRIAILTHSTHPRGGVVHALELAEALVRLGHHAVLHAPDPGQAGFFRPAACETVSVPARPAPGDVADLLALRRQEYRDYFAGKANRDFDIFHAQDSISANALADMKTVLPGFRFARTVHHLDRFGDARLMAAQARGVAAAAQHFVVSRQWRDHLRQHFGVPAGIVGNGVDLARYRPDQDGEDTLLRSQLALGPGPILLAIGGIEERKNTLRILQAFQHIRGLHPTAQLLIAGGASLLDHAGYQNEFHAARLAMHLPEAVIRILGNVPQASMPALYRAASALVFPSIREGFGLAVLEAMACGIPVVAPRIPPFTEYLGDADAAWCNPYDVESISQAVRQALDPRLGGKFIARGAVVAASHGWESTAAAHLDGYAQLRMPEAMHHA